MDWTTVLLMVGRLFSDPVDLAWAGTLTRLDAMRAEAFATGSPALLDDVYTADSPARRHDARLLDDYARRGARVDGADLVLLDCRTLEVSGDRVTLEVVDRLGEATAVWSDGTRRRLPRDEPTRRVVVLVGTSDGWRIAG